MRLRAILLVALVVGCRDLSVPKPGEGPGTGPFLSFESPGEGQTVALLTQVFLDAQDASGVREVTLRCSGRTIFAWTHAPFQSVVDLSPCADPSQSGPGTSLVPVTLVAHARDGQGNESEIELGVNVDVDVAVLTAQLPDRVGPGRPLTVTLRSDRPLLAPPSVRLSGQAAEVSDEVAEPLPDGGAGARYVATLQTPALGLDAHPVAPGQEAPLEVLEQIEASFPLAISGYSRSGNPTRIDLSLVVSRLSWERPLPGTVDDSPGALTPEGRATPYETGLGVPVTVGDAGWLPAYFAASDGTFTPVANVLVDGGFVGRGFDNEGHAVVQAPASGWSAATADASIALDGGGTIDAGSLVPGTPVMRIGSALCQVSGTAACGTPSDVLCEDFAQGPSMQSMVVPLDGRSFVEVIGTTVGSSFSGATLGGASCGANRSSPFTTVVGELGNLHLGQAFPDVVTVERIYPVGDGFFGMDLVAAAGNPKRTVLFDGQGKSVGEFPFRAKGSTATPLLIRPDHRLITARTEPAYTVFETWGLGGTSPLGSSRIAGSYSLQEHQIGGLPSYFALNAVHGPDGGWAVLMSNNDSPLQQVVVVFGGAASASEPARPRWLYRDPALAFVGEGHQLLSSPVSGRIYLVNVTSARVVSLLY